MTQSPNCPGCGAADMAPMASPLPHLRCGSCGGRGLDAAASRTLMLEVAQIPPQEIGALMHAAAHVGQPCFSCGMRTSGISLREQPLTVCSSCGSAFLPAGSMSKLSEGAWPEDLDTIGASRLAPSVGQGLSPDAPPATPPPTTRPMPQGTAPGGPTSAMSAAGARPRVMGTGGGAAKSAMPSASVVAGIAVAAALVVVGVFVYMQFAKDDKPKVARKSLSDDPSLLRKQMAVYLDTYTFGGQTVGWWREELKATAPGGDEADAARHALLRKRAQRVGMELLDDGAGPVDVQIDDDTLKLLAQRIGLK